MKNQKILVVGGAGYIGSHVVKTLKNAGYNPLAFDNLSTGLKQNLFPDCEFILGDILDFNKLKEAVAGSEAVIHLAALKAAGDSMIHPEKYALNNIIGAVNLLNAMAETGVRKIVFSSSAAVYGSPKYLPMDEKHPVEPENFYGYTKLAVENLLYWYGKLKNVKFAALRYFNAVGYDADGFPCGREKNPANLLPIIMEAVIGERPQVTVFGGDYNTPDGSCVRDYIHVTDLADAHLRSLDYLEKNDQNLIVNLGTAKGASVLEMIKAVKDISGVDFKVVMGERRAGDPATVLADASLAKKVLNWEPKFSDLETVIRTTLKAY